jgi:hypothetical protein
LAPRLRLATAPRRHADAFPSEGCASAVLSLVASAASGEVRDTEVCRTVALQSAEKTIER